MSDSTQTSEPMTAVVTSAGDDGSGDAVGLRFGKSKHSIQIRCSREMARVGGRNMLGPVTVCLRTYRDTEGRVIDELVSIEPAAAEGKS